MPRHAPRPRPQLPPAAGFLRRALATVLDVLLFLGVAVLMLRPLLSRLAVLGPQPAAELLVSVMASPPLLHLAAVTGAALAFTWWAYVVLGWGVFGATAGKRLMGLAVVDHCGRHPIGVVRAQLRLIAYTLSSLPLGAGHLLVALRSDHRALHDILAGTRVIRRRDLPRLPAAGESPGEEGPEHAAGTPDVSRTGDG